MIWARLLLLLLAALGLAFLLYAAPGEQPARLPAAAPIEVVGYYTLTDDAGKVRGIVCITRRPPHDDYLFQWFFPGVVAPAFGVGLRDGNTISVGWRHGESVGVSRFAATLDKAEKPRLEGRWSNLAAQGVEILTWLRSLD